MVRVLSASLLAGGRLSRRGIVPRALLACAVTALSSSATYEVQAAEPERPVETIAPAYTLSIDSDDEDRLSYDAIAPRLAAELVGAVAAPKTRPLRASIVIRYRSGLLTVRAEHKGDRVLERSIRAEGDAAAVQREALLLASNLARDEARELLDELSKGTATEEEAPPAPEPTAGPKSKEEVLPSHPMTAAVFFPLATNAGVPDVRSPFNLGLFYGRVGRSAGFQLTLAGVGYASRGASGMQISSLVNASGGKLDGVQIGGVVNSANEVSGAQIAGAVDVAGGAVSGAQISGVVDVAGGNVSGVQIAGAVDVATGDLSGAQISGVFDYARSVYGAQIAGGMALSGGRTRGPQLSGVGNVSRGGGFGLQLAGGFNLVSDSFEGAQIGTFNLGDEIHGAQIGIINVARRVKGAQIGIINIAEEPTEAVGIINIMRDSIHPILWASNLHYTNVGLKFMSKHVYSTTALTIGTNESKFDGEVGVTTTIGGHVDFGKLDVELEGGYSHIEGVSEQNSATHQRAMVGYNFAKHLRVFAGGGARIPARFDRGSLAVRPEFLAGVQF